MTEQEYKELVAIRDGAPDETARVKPTHWIPKPPQEKDDD